MAVDSSYNFIALTGKKGEKGDSSESANYLGILNSLPESASTGDYFTAGEITRVDTTTTTTTTTSSSPSSFELKSKSSSSSSSSSLLSQLSSYSSSFLL